MWMQTRTYLYRFSTSFPRGCGEFGSAGGRPGSVRNFLFLAITVARQHRSLTGFALQPSHPGVRRLRSIMNFKALYVQMRDPSSDGSMNFNYWRDNLERRVFTVLPTPPRYGGAVMA